MRSVMFNRPPFFNPRCRPPVPGNTLGTPWNAYREGPPNTNRSPERSSTSRYGAVRVSVLPKRNVHVSPRDRDTMGAAENSSLSWCIPMCAAPS